MLLCQMRDIVILRLEGKGGALAQNTHNTIPCTLHRISDKSKGWLSAIDGMLVLPLEPLKGLTLRCYQPFPMAVKDEI